MRCGGAEVMSAASRAGSLPRSVQINKDQYTCTKDLEKIVDDSGIAHTASVGKTLKDGRMRSNITKPTAAATPTSEDLEMEED